MVFSSHLFVFWFLPAFLALYFASPRRAKNLVLTLASYVFYGWSNPYFAPVMLLSTVLDYVFGLVIGRARANGKPGVAKGGLVASVISNLSLLAFFKYFNFGIDSWNATMQALGLEDAALHTALRIALPLGISFYTFQSMSYTIDVCRGAATPVKSFVDFACFVAMFPQLVAGPIIRFREIDEQIRTRDHSFEKFARGVAMFALGMSKKVLLANPCGRIADATFDAGTLGAFDAWYGAAAYAFQIYFDFSGYSDMAIGLGLMLGFTFPKNFDSPYRSRSITEFWRRWHISLSSWLRDYLYVPLGGNRKGPARTYVNLMLVMLLGGLWHGADWKFVAWGAIHGVWLALERALGKKSVYQALPAVLRVAITFGIVLIAWVFFRADGIGHASRYLGCMFGAGGASPADLAATAFAPQLASTFLAAAVIAFAAPQSWDWTRRLAPERVAVALALLVVALLVMEFQPYNPFIYFIF